MSKLFRLTVQRACRCSDSYFVKLSKNYGRTKGMKCGAKARLQFCHRSRGSNRHGSGYTRRPEPARYAGRSKGWRRQKGKEVRTSRPACSSRSQAAKAKGS